MHWDVVVSKQFEDYNIAASKIGLLNYNSLDEDEFFKFVVLDQINLIQANLNSLGRV